MSDIVERLRKRATVVYLAAETTVADDLASTMTEAADEIERLRELVLDLTRQACERDGELNSMATSTYADAIVYLGSIGQVEIEHQAGRWVIGKVVRHDD